VAQRHCGDRRELRRAAVIERFGIDGKQGANPCKPSVLS
jgi:hypothetical protein